MKRKCKDCGSDSYTITRKIIYLSNICDRCWNNREFFVEHIKFFTEKEFKSIQNSMRMHYHTVPNKIQKVRVRLKNTMNYVFKNRKTYRIKKEN